jgi:phage terminase large subunit-like protein
MVAGNPGAQEPGVGRIALVGETLADVRDVMIGGPSGLLAVSPPGERPR